MKKLIEIFKGIIVGIGNIIPGVSGGTLAIIFGIYDKLIAGISEFFKHPFKVLKDLYIYLIGISLGIVISILILSYLFKRQPVITTSFFIGLVIGAVPFIYRNVKSEKPNKFNWIIFIVMLIIVAIFPLLKTENTPQNIELNFVNSIILFFLGCIIAITIVVPGVSGSMILMTIGYYDFFLETLSETIKAMLKFDFVVIFEHGLILLPFGLGLILGVITTAKIIKYLFENHSINVYYAILGLLVASPFPILYSLNYEKFNMTILFFSILSFLIGLVITYNFEKIKKDEDKDGFLSDSEKILQ